LGFQVLTGLPGHFYFLKKSKRRRFSKKTIKSQRVATGFFTGSCRVNPPGQPTVSYWVFPSPIFSSTQPYSSPGSQVDPPGQVLTGLPGQFYFLKKLKRRRFS
jgi:hypothetical protein